MGFRIYINPKMKQVSVGIVPESLHQITKDFVEAFKHAWRVLELIYKGDYNGIEDYCKDNKLDCKVFDDGRIMVYLF